MSWMGMQEEQVSEKRQPLSLGVVRVVYCRKITGVNSVITQKGLIYPVSASGPLHSQYFMTPLNLDL